MSTYESNGDLPTLVRSVLPAEAQTLYRDAYNAAWKGYVMPIRRGITSRHDTYAARMAWTAVRKHYVENCDTWIRRGPTDAPGIG